jgi:penicillin G amidase
MGIFQRFSALIVTLIVLIAIVVGFSLNLATISSIDDDQIEETSAISDSIHIYRNKFSIPHVITKNEQDMFFALGYAHAQDRLWQMDFLRRVARGRLSEVVGKEAIEADKFFRILGIGRIAERLHQNISKQSLNLLNAYSSGINEFIKANKDKVPMEFGALGYTPEEWKSSDCLAIARLMSFDMSMSFWTDLAIGEIADTLGVEKAKNFIPSYPDYAPTVCQQGVSISAQQKLNVIQRDTIERDTSVLKPIDSTLTPIDSLRRLGSLFNTKQTNHSSLLERRSSNQSVRAEMLASVSGMMFRVRQFIGFRGMQSGSNSWVVKTNKSSNALGKNYPVILANDPHLTLGLPSRWYQVHLTCPTINAIGLSIPGVPAIISGRNNSISWGITNIMLDDFDYFFERVEGKDNGLYISPEGRKSKFTYIRDTIKVRKANDEIYEFRATKRSAVISDASITSTKENIIRYPASNRSLTKNYVLTFSWTAREMSDEILCAYKILKAKNWSQFSDAVSSWNTPALNFTYADNRGNMGIVPSGFIPIRGEENPNFPHPGWESKFGWKGVRKGDQLPHIYNPQRGFVLSANNMTSRDIPFHVSSLWEPSSRSERIEALLNAYQFYSVRDAQFMQMDLTSPHAERLLKKVLPLLNADTLSLPIEQRRIVAQLNKWDCVMTSRDAMPALYTVFLQKLMMRTFTYKISYPLYLKYAFVGSLPFRRTLEIYQDSSYSWFSSQADIGKSSAKRIVIQSLRDALFELGEALGNNPTTWKYGDIHPLHLRHPFDAQPSMRTVVSSTLNTLGGDATTINNTLWRVHNPFDIAVGASMRFITDMSESYVYFVLPGGSSGQPLDAHYTDQLQLWANGGYVRMSISPNVENDAVLSTVIIKKSK